VDLELALLRLLGHDDLGGKLLAQLE
jgi:hypothetical protein